MKGDGPRARRAPPWRCPPAVSEWGAHRRRAREPADRTATQSTKRAGAPAATTTAGPLQRPPPRDGSPAIRRESQNSCRHPLRANHQPTTIARPSSAAPTTPTIRRFRSPVRCSSARMTCSDDGLGPPPRQVGDLLERGERLLHVGGVEVGAPRHGDHHPADAAHDLERRLAERTVADAAAGAAPQQRLDLAPRQSRVVHLIGAGVERVGHCVGEAARRPCKKRVQGAAGLASSGSAAARTPVIAAKRTPCRRNSMTSAFSSAKRSWADARAGSIGAIMTWVPPIRA